MTLARVPVTVRSEDHDDSTLRHPPYGFEGVQERIRTVAEVDIDGGATIAGHTLSATREVRVDTVCDGMADRLEFKARLDEHDDGQRGVGGHVPPDDGYGRL